MSSTDHPESGVPDSSDHHESGATTTSPQQSSQPQPTTTESSAAPENPVSLADAPAFTAAAESQPSAAGELAATAPQHPAIGGESVAPMTATTTIPANDTANAVAQPQNPETPSMATSEPKPGAELSSDQSEDISGKEVEDVGPSLVITLLLTTGSRHPFTIDAKYLRKQSVQVENDDPFAMSVYTLKELIWREWRSGELEYLRTLPLVGGNAMFCY